MSSWLTRRRARKTQAQVDAERARLREIYDDDALVEEVRSALARAERDAAGPPPPPPVVKKPAVERRL